MAENQDPEERLVISLRTIVRLADEGLAKDPQADKFKKIKASAKDTLLIMRSNFDTMQHDMSSFRGNNG